MKRLFQISILSFFFFSPSFAQWQNTFLYESTLSPLDMEILQNDRIIVGGYYFDNKQNKRTFTLLFNSNTGEDIEFIDCENPVNCDGINDIRKIISNSNGDIFISGGKQFGDENYLSKLQGNDFLNREWMRKDLGMDDIHLIDAMEVIDDCIVVAGRFADFEYDVVKIDSDGNTVWAQGFPTSELTREAFLVKTATNDLIISFRNGSSPETEYISKINNTTGFVEWIKTIEEEVLLVQTNSTDELIVLERVIIDNEHILSLNKYNFENDTKLVLNENIGSKFPTQMRINSKDEIILAGDYRHAFTHENALYLEVYGSNGQLICTDDFFEMGIDDTVFNDVLKDMEIDNEENIFLLGIRDIPANPTIQRSGLIISSKSCVASSTIDKNVPEFITYPNPSSHLLFFQNQVYSKVQVFDNLGRQVIVQNLVNNSLDISALSAGYYYIQFTKDRKHYFQQIIKL